MKTYLAKHTYLILRRSRNARNASMIDDVYTVVAEVLAFTATGALKAAGLDGTPGVYIAVKADSLLVRPKYTGQSVGWEG